MVSRPDYHKTTCCIMGCKSWSRKFRGEWMCARHWKMVGARERRLLRKIWRKRRDLGSLSTHTQDEIDRDWSLYHLGEKLWARARDRVMGDCAGI
jgi:hypothetical protein